MKSAKIQPTYRVGDCSTEYPVPRKPMGVLEIILHVIACTFLIWIFAWPLANMVLQPLLKVMGAL